MNKMSAKPFLTKSIRSVFTLINQLDRLDLPLLRLIPAKTKRNLLRAVYKPLTAKLPPIVEIDGLLFHIPRSLDYCYLLQEHEPQTKAILKQQLQSGMRVLDVGANVGYLTLFMARLVGPTGKVYAVEPGPDNLTWLEKNVKLNGLNNVEILPFAASAVQRESRLFLSRAGTLHSLHRQSSIMVESTSVREVPLDLVIQDKVDFVKMDVEGSEVDALTGMKQLLSNKKIRLLLEWNPRALENAGRKTSDLPDLLQELGFCLSLINDNGNSQTSLAEVITGWQQGKLAHSWHTNLFAQRLEKHSL